MSIRLLAALSAVAVLTACTSGGSSGGPGSTSPSSGRTSGSATPSASPTVAVAARSCPSVSQSFVADTTGMRQGRITVLRSAGAVVGCRFYAQAHPDAECGQSCFDGEHLPPPSQPAVEIVTRTYPSATAAHNAFVLAARQGTSASSVTIRSGVPGITYRTTFYPKDGARDWACAWSVGTRATFVRLAENSSSGQLEVALLAQRVARAG